jgi:ATP-dependent Clp protease, protease subunit
MGGTATSNAATERWIRFQGEINPKSGQALTQVVDDCLGAGVGRIHLMISSGGGWVFHGLNLYSQLRRAPIKITTYNIATVESIAMPLFCAGNERYCVPEARFMIHPVATQLAPNQFFNAEQFQNLSQMCTTQTRRIANIIADTTGKELDEVYEDMGRTTWLNAQQSQSYGLVNSVVTDLLPPDTDLTAISEDGSVRTYSPSTARIQKLPPGLLASLGLNSPGTPGAPSAPVSSN